MARNHEGVMHMWKDILKGEEVHPSVKGFISRGVSKIRQAMIKEKEDIEVAEEFMQGEIYERYPEEIKERIQKNLKIAKKNIEKLGKVIGSKFNPQHDKFRMTASQRLSPSKPPKPKRMERPIAFSYDPNDTFDSNVMRRFGMSKELFESLGEKTRKVLREEFKNLEGDK